MAALTDDQKTQLVSVYEEAQKTGDSAAMQRIAGVLKADRDSAAPAAPPAAEAAPAPRSTNILDVISNERAQEAKDLPQRQREGKYVLAEGARRAGAGLVQLAGYFGGSPDQQASYTKQEDARRASFNAEHGSDTGGAADAIAGLLPVGGAASEAGRGATFVGTLLRRMVAGGAAGATQYVPTGGSRTENAAVGATLGGVIGGAVAVKNAAKNVVSRMVTKAESNSRTAATVAAAAPFFDRSKAVINPAPYSVGQASGSPTLDRLEKQAYGPYQQELRASQYDQVSARFNELADNATKLTKVPATSEGVATAISTELNNEVMSLRGVRNVAFKNGMSDVVRLSGPSGGPGIIKLDNLRDAYGSIIQQDSNAFNFNGSTLPANIKATLDQLNSMPRSLRLKLPTIQQIMQGLGQDAPHGTGPFLDPAQARAEVYRKQLFAALGADVDAAGISTTSNPAYAKLQQVRKDYAVNSDKLRAVENGVLNRVFGDPEAIQSPQAALDRYTAMRSADKVAAVNLLSRRSPDLLQAMRANRIKTAIQDATQPGAAKNSAFSVAAFNQSMFGGDAAKDPMWGNDETSNAIKAGAAHLRVILNSTEGGPGSLVTPSDLAINAVSRNPAFAARIATRVAYGKYGDKLLGTPEGLNALRTLANTSSRKSAAFSQALAYMVGLSQQPQAPGNPSGPGAADTPGLDTQKYAMRADDPSADSSKWDRRADGTSKGQGWLGLLKRPDGRVSSELSIGVELGGKEVEIPTMVPTLTQGELDYLMTHRPDAHALPASIKAKAIAHARARLAAGKSPFNE